MQILLRSITSLVLSSSLLCATQAAVLSIPISISQNEVLNGTLTGGVPTQFSAIPLPERGGTLEKWDCLELAVKIIAGLAHLDFNEQIRPVRWSSGAPSCLLIGVSLSGTQRGIRGIEARYVIWGIYETVKGMISNVEPHAAIYQLKWQGNIVGALAFYHSHVLSLPSNETISNLTQDVPYGYLSNIADPAQLVLPSPNVSALAAPTPGLTVAFQVVSRSYNRSLNPYGVFINILSPLLEAAEHSENLAIRSPFTAPVGSYAAVQATVSGPENSKSMLRPLFFKYGYLCEGLVGLSRDLISPRRKAQLDDLYEEFKIRLFIDGVEIGVVHFESSS